MAKRKGEDRCVMFIDADPISRMEIGRGVQDFGLLTWPYTGKIEVLAFVRGAKPCAILLGFRFPGAGVNGAEIAQFLRDDGYRGILVGNSRRGARIFEDRGGVELDFYVNRSKRAFRELLERIRQGTIRPRRATRRRSAKA